MVMQCKFAKCRSVEWHRAKCGGTKNRDLPILFVEFPAKNSDRKLIGICNLAKVNYYGTGP